MRSFLLVLLFLLTACMVSAQTVDKTYSVDIQNGLFDSFVRDIEKDGTYHFYYDESDLSALRINITAKNRSLKDILRAMFNGTPFRYAIDDEHNVFISRHSALVVRPQWSEGNTDSVRVDLPVANDNRIYLIGVRTNKYAKGKVVFTGIVKDAVTNVVVNGALISIDNGKQYTQTDSLGRFSIELERGLHDVAVSADNKTTLSRRIDVYSEGSLSFALRDEVKVLNEVIVSARRNSIVSRPQMGLERLNIKTIKQIPAALGEADILKAILTLPGVKTVGEASSGFNVRGGATDQNLVLFNETTIFNPTHFFGLFSSFNPEIVKDVELYKSSIPVKYGGRLSSVLNISAKEGNKQKFQGTAGIGLLTSRINLGGPLMKDRMSFVLGARTTYSNWLLKMLPNKNQYRNSKAGFQDINLGIHHIINSKNELQLTAYGSRDQFNLNSDTIFGYQNLNLSAKWRHNFSKKLVADFVGGYDSYGYYNSSDNDPLNAYKMQFDLSQFHARADLNYYLSPVNVIEFGLSGISYKLHPGEFKPVGKESIVQRKTIADEQAAELSAYGGVRLDLSDRLSMQAGLRINMYGAMGPGTVNQYVDGLPKDESTFLGTKDYGNGKFIKQYMGPEARIAFRYLLTDELSVKAGFNSTRQNIHMLSNTTAISPTDIWKLSDANIKPQQGNQYSLGFYRNVFSDSLEISLEGYYKTISNYLDYRSGATLVLNETLERDVVSTKGKAYGIEFMIRKKTGKLNGWFSYTYSRTLLKLNDVANGVVINRGQWYPSNYDKPHDATLVGNYRVNLRFSVSLNMTYSTGRPITLPIGTYYFAGSQRSLYSDRNAYRIPDYFRADLAMNIDGNHKVKQRTHNSWTIGVYNLTGRKNPYSVYFNSENGLTKGYKLSIFGSVIPFVNFNIRF